MRLSFLNYITPLLISLILVGCFEQIKSDSEPIPKIFFGNKLRQNVDADGHTITDVILTDAVLDSVVVYGYVKTNHDTNVRIEVPAENNIANNPAQLTIAASGGRNGVSVDFITGDYWGVLHWIGTIGADRHSDMDYDNIHFGSLNEAGDGYSTFAVALGDEDDATPKGYVDGLVSNLESGLFENATSEVFSVRGMALVEEDNLDSPDNWILTGVNSWEEDGGYYGGSPSIKVGGSSGSSIYSKGSFQNAQYLVSLEMWCQSTLQLAIYYVDGSMENTNYLTTFVGVPWTTKTNYVYFSSDWSSIIVSNVSAPVWAYIDNLKIYSAPIFSGMEFRNDFSTNRRGAISYKYSNGLFKIEADLVEIDAPFNLNENNTTNAGNIHSFPSSGHKLYADTSESSISGLTDLHFYKSSETWKGSPVYYGSQGRYFLWTYDVYMYGYQWLITTNPPSDDPLGAGGYWMVDEPSGPIAGYYTNFTTEESIKISYEPMEIMDGVSELQAKLINATNKIGDLQSEVIGVIKTNEDGKITSPIFIEVEGVDNEPNAPPQLIVKNTVGNSSASIEIQDGDGFVGRIGKDNHADMDYGGPNIFGSMTENGEDLAPFAVALNSDERTATPRSYVDGRFDEFLTYEESIIDPMGDDYPAFLLSVGAAGDNVQGISRHMDTPTGDWIYSAFSDDIMWFKRGEYTEMNWIRAFDLYYDYDEIEEKVTGGHAIWKGTIDGYGVGSDTNGNFNANSLSLSIVKKTEVNYAIKVNDSTIIMATAISPRTVTLPAVASVLVGKQYVIKRVGDANVIIQASGSEKIDGENSFTISQDLQALTIQTDGVEWFIIGDAN